MSRHVNCLCIALVIMYIYLLVIPVWYFGVLTFISILFLGVYGILEPKKQKRRKT